MAIRYSSQGFASGLPCLALSLLLLLGLALLAVPCCDVPSATGCERGTALHPVRPSGLAAAATVAPGPPARLAHAAPPLTPAPVVPSMLAALNDPSALPLLI